MGDTVLGKVYPNHGKKQIILRGRVCNLVNHSTVKVLNVVFAQALQK